MANPLIRASILVPEKLRTVLGSRRIWIRNQGRQAKSSSLSGALMFSPVWSLENWAGARVEGRKQRSFLFLKGNLSS